MKGTKLSQLLTITNATKAQIISAINAVFAVLIAFNVVLSQSQLGAVDIAVNAVLSLFVAITYTASSMRLKQARPTATKKPAAKTPAAK